MFLHHELHLDCKYLHFLQLFAITNKSININKIIFLFEIIENNLCTWSITYPNTIGPGTVPNPLMKIIWSPIAKERKLCSTDLFYPKKYHKIVKVSFSKNSLIKKYLKLATRPGIVATKVKSTLRNNKTENQM